MRITYEIYPGKVTGYQGLPETKLTFYETKTSRHKSLGTERGKYIKKIHVNATFGISRN